jgi:hypothetical protein
VIERLIQLLDLGGSPDEAAERQAPFEDRDQNHLDNQPAFSLLIAPSGW